MDGKGYLDRWRAGEALRLDSYDYDAVADHLVERAVEIGDEVDADVDQAIADLLELVAFASVAVREGPGILRRLSKFIRKLRDGALKIAAKSGASSVDISVGTPFNVSIGLSWPTKDD